MTSLLVSPQPPPPLNIPESSATVTVRVIDSTTTVHGSLKIFAEPVPDGFREDLECPAYSFLISHGDRHLLFDLGVRKDWWNLPPVVTDGFIGPDKPFQVDVTHNVADILQDDKGNLGIKPKDIEAVIWSHHHWDHTGHLDSFPKSTGLIVGPGFKEALLPFYPTDPKSTCHESDVEGREFREIDIAKEGKGLKVGRCDAFDFFGDGSFYLLSTPGHAPGHVCALARLNSVASTFVFMGGDACHHAGQIRPSQYLPLPAEIRPSPIPKFHPGACPGAALQDLQRHKRADETFFDPNPNACVDLSDTKDSQSKMREFDASADVLVVFAHDRSLRGSLPFYPETVNDWKDANLAERTRWLFLSDFSDMI